MKSIYYLQHQKDSFLIESTSHIITWLDWIGIDAIATPDLIILTEQFYFEN
jgi:hypothetical protein